MKIWVVVNHPQDSGHTMIGAFKSKEEAIAQAKISRPYPNWPEWTLDPEDNFVEEVELI